MHKVLHNIGKLIYGRGAIAQAPDQLNALRRSENDFVVFIIDHYFKGHEVLEKLQISSQDVVHYIDCDVKEPTTEQVDIVRDQILSEHGLPVCVVGMGGGSIMDIAKAVSLMMTSEGSSTLYQGLNLIKKPGVYHLGIPTISGTGAECSTTAVLTGPEKKLGLKCAWTVFDELILDPELTQSVPREHWFYTGMDTYIHCIESETGIHKNAFSEAYGEESLKLCRGVFSGSNAGQNPENDDKLMIASLFGGLSLTYSEVGVCHALSYGLSKILGYRHGYANCVAFQHLEEFYGAAVLEFKDMLKLNEIELPQNLSAEWSEEQINAMAKVAWSLPHMWIHALGYDWEKKLTLSDIEELYRKL